jgi:PBSX family phage terminase large subunit
MDPTLFGPIASMITYTAGAPTAQVLGRTVWVLGSSDVKSEKILRGLTCAGAYVDEVTLLKEDFFTQLLNRLWEGAKLFGTTNPDNPAHWLKRRFLDRLNQLPDWRTWKFVLDDNPMLSEARKDAIRRENTGLFYRRNVLGEWVAAEGAVWDPDKHVIPHAELPPMRTLLGIGIDYGTTNATAAELLGLGMDNKLYFVDEWEYDPAQAQIRKTDADLSAGIRGWMARAQAELGMRSEWTLVDPAAASFKVQLIADGVENVINADNNVTYGIRTMASLLGSEKLLVSDRCQGLIREVPGYSWDPKATEKGEDKPLKVADHRLDGGRYAITTTETNWRNWVDLAA